MSLFRCILLVVLVRHVLDEPDVPHVVHVAEGGFLDELVGDENEGEDDGLFGGSGLVSVSI